jgi:hypothetical protein
MWHAWGREYGFIGFWFGGLTGQDQWEDQGGGGSITLRWNLGRYGSIGRTGFRWLRIGSVAGF